MSETERDDQDIEVSSPSNPLFHAPSPSALFKVVRRILLSSLVFAILLLVGVSILSLTGGNDPALKEGLEKFFRDYTGAKTSIEKLNDLQIYPVLHMDIEGLVSGSENTGFSAKHLIVGMSFWDAVFSRGWITASAVEGLSFSAGYLLPHALIVHTLSLGGEGKKAALEANGSYNGVDFSLTVAMKTRSARYGLLYRIADQAKFTFSIGELIFSGVLLPPENKGEMLFSDLSVSTQKDHATPLLTGSALLIRNHATKEVNFHLKSNRMALPQTEFIAKASLLQAGPVSGSFIFPEARPEDFSSDAPFIKILDLLNDLFASKTGGEESLSLQTETPVAPPPVHTTSGTFILTAGMEKGTPAFFGGEKAPVFSCLVGRLVFDDRGTRFEKIYGYTKTKEIFADQDGFAFIPKVPELPDWQLNPKSYTDVNPLLSLTKDSLPSSSQCFSAIESQP